MLELCMITEALTETSFSADKLSAWHKHSR